MSDDNVVNITDRIKKRNDELQEENDYTLPIQYIIDGDDESIAAYAESRAYSIFESNHKLFTWLLDAGFEEIVITNKEHIGDRLSLLACIVSSILEELETGTPSPFLELMLPHAIKDASRHGGYVPEIRIQTEGDEIYMIQDYLDLDTPPESD